MPPEPKPVGTRVGGWRWTLPRYPLVGNLTALLGSFFGIYRSGPPLREVIEEMIIIIMNLFTVDSFE